MHARPCVLLTAGLAAALAGSAAAASPARPLVDLAPRTTAFRDHVGPVAARPRAAGDSKPAAYAAPDGQSVSVQFSGSYAPDAEVAQSYVDFLGLLPHGSELRRLRISIRTPAEVQEACGGVAGTLACYDPSSSRMTVPGGADAESQDADGVSTSYVVAHEYGHHIARWRSNAPFPALAFGPKRWASQELVCLNAIRGRLAPGDEGQNYLANPGEAWADAYAHLKYPDTFWQFTQLLRPDAASKAAARRDVLAPWTGPVTEVFRGSFAPGGPATKVFRLTLRLDGSLRVRLAGPRGANFDVALSSLGQDRGGSSGPTASDSYAVRYACREVAAERVNLKVRRRQGFGAFTATVTYAG